MIIHIDVAEIISLKDFELGKRWGATYNNISEQEINHIQPLTICESKRLHKVIRHFQLEYNLLEKYSQTNWVSASADNNQKIERFRNQLELTLKPWDEDVIITWHRNITLKTTKAIFLKYWSDFLYANSDNVTIISEKTNWVIFYHPVEVANIWTRKIHIMETHKNKTTPLWNGFTFPN